jgi:hypothetical protein
MDMLLVYKTLSANIGAAIQSSGEAITKQPLIRAMRAVKRDVLKLISIWVGKSEDEALVRWPPHRMPLYDHMAGHGELCAAAARGCAGRLPR